MKSQRALVLALAVMCALLSLVGCNEKPSPTNNPTTTATTAPTAPPTSAASTDTTDSPADTTTPPAEPPSLGNATNEPAKVIRGGSCTYKDTPGTATITAITDPAANQNACPKTPKMVAFSFTPEGATAPTFTDRHITIGDGKHPPEACLEPLGLKVGATFPITLKEITGGTCTPVIFSWGEGFLKPCSDACF